MTNNTNRKEITCIGTNILESIITLYETAKSFSYSGKSKIRVSSRENGFAVSITILSVLLIESILNRIKYLKSDTEKNNVEFFKNQFTKEILLYKKLKEIYILRDVIIHNHIWEINYVYNNNYEETKIQRKLTQIYGDKKFRECLNEQMHKTKILKLNIIPTKISLKDIIIIFKAIKKLLIFLKKKNRNYIYLNEYYKYDGKLLTFLDIINTIITNTTKDKE